MWSKGVVSMLTTDKLYVACNKYNWCTSATTATYDKILKMPNRFETKDIALAIWLVTNDGQSYDSIYSKLKSISRRNRV